MTIKLRSLGNDAKKESKSTPCQVPIQFAPPFDEYLPSKAHATCQCCRRVGDGRRGRASVPSNSRIKHQGEGQFDLHLMSTL